MVRGAEWTLSEAARLLRQPQHRLIYLCEKAAVIPDYADAHGRGSSRRFSARNLLEFFLDHPELARLWIHDILNSRDGSPSESWNTFIARLEAFTKSGGTRDGIDAEMLGRILLGAPLVWSLWANRKAEAEEERRRLVRRFGREIKRLLLFGVMKPEAWPAMVAELKAAASDDDERET